MGDDVNTEARTFFRIGTGLMVAIIFLGLAWVINSGWPERSPFDPKPTTIYITPAPRIEAPAGSHTLPDMCFDGDSWVVC